ncbi:MAG: hypothetical protein RSA73_07630 [Anaerovoracaceae bacterium]
MSEAKGVVATIPSLFCREGRTYMWAKPTHTTSLRFVSPLPERSYADSTISWRATLSVLYYAKLLCGQHSYAEGGLADS